LKESLTKETVFLKTFFLKGLNPWIKGGAEKRIYEISRRLVERGHEVHLRKAFFDQTFPKSLRDNVVGWLEGYCGGRDIFYMG